MTGDPTFDGMRKIAAGFAELLRLLTHDGETERPKDERDVLVDRLRDALDRRLPSLADNAAFIGNTFLIEAVVYRNKRTEISRLRHRDLGTFHAMKTLPVDRINDTIARELLLREARIGMMLCGSNLVATQCSLRLPDGRPAIIMPWVGPSLPQRLNTRSLCVAEVEAMAKSMLAGLSTIHRAGYVHGDVSPANLLVADGDIERLVISDFGTTLERGAHYRDLDIARAATTGFTAPEISGDTAMDFNTDIYSAGRTISLLLDHCHETGDTVTRLKTAARVFASVDPSERPPDAMAALAIIK
ncbi:MAG: serine/threonine protein kinase [Rhizobium sp.]|nr:MAG: serine/threonine protein kinase [Rhizobium sp.]